MANDAPTPRQAQFLAYIHLYMLVNGRAPAQADIQQFFQITPPSVNTMLQTLERRGFINRIPGQARSISLIVDPATLPPLSRVLPIAQPAPPAKAKTKAPARPVYQFKIELLELEPAIWRRIQIEDCTLDHFHSHIQTAMGWTNSHLHCFFVNQQTYGNPRLSCDDDQLDSTTTKISDILPKGAEEFSLFYEYDFGDSWEHEILFEGIVESPSAGGYPVCVEGERACPPDDCGGVPGFEEYVAVITNPNDEQYREFLEWMGPFDPDSFDPKKATKAMRKGLPSW